jgi:hypothetical protein
MSRKSVIVGIAIAITILVIADLLTARLASNSVPRQLIRIIVSAPRQIDVLGMGNSLMTAGFDPSVFEEKCETAGRPCTAVNGALAATGLIEHLALTRLAYRDHSVGILVYGFFDQQLTSAVADKNSEIVGTRSLLYYLEPDLTLRYARFDPLDRLFFRAYSSVALLRERGALWAKVEKLRRTMSSVGTPSQQTNEFGRAGDFARLEANDSRAFELSCENVIRSNQFLSAPVEALFRQAREHATKVLVVEMPMHPEHIKRFYNQPIWSDLRTQTRQRVERVGASYLNASTWVPDESMFVDHLHLSAAGGRKFSQRLAEFLLANPL